MRNVFIEELVIAARTGFNVALIVGDLGYKVVEPFANEFPNRFFNAGIAEQNMMGLSAGLASEGHHVFVYSIANFPTFRCAEQIRNDVDYHNLPVTIVTFGGGLVYGSLGYSHHAIQDYSLMRTLPNMLIAAPGDRQEVRACMRYLLKNPSPSYLRLGKACESNFHSEVPIISPGEWIKVGNHRSNTKRTILTTGATLELGNRLLSENVVSDSELYSMPLWSMKAKVNQKIQVSAWDEITIFEDHLIDGGFSSWMLEALMHDKKEITKIVARALDPKVCGSVGSQAALNVLGGLS